jgi:hypothetical protein
MSFPTSPTNGQQATVNGIVYNYNSTKGAWIKTVTTADTLTTGNIVITSNIASTNTTNGALIVTGGLGVAGNINVGLTSSRHLVNGLIELGPAGNVVVASNAPSTSTTTGALVVRGGIGVAGDINTAGNINTSANINTASSITAARVNNTGQFYYNTRTISANVTIGATENAMSIGPMTIADGVEVVINDGGEWSIV